MLGFKLMTFRSVARSLNHLSTTSQKGAVFSGVLTPFLLRYSQAVLKGSTYNLFLIYLLRHFTHPQWCLMSDDNESLLSTYTVQHSEMLFFAYLSHDTAPLELRALIKDPSDQ